MDRLLQSLSCEDTSLEELVNCFGSLLRLELASEHRYLLLLGLVERVVIVSVDTTEAEGCHTL